jgi:hypothetical protein
VNKRIVFLLIGFTRKDSKLLVTHLPELWLEVPAATWGSDGPWKM